MVSSRYLLFFQIATQSFRIVYTRPRWFNPNGKTHTTSIRILGHTAFLSTAGDFGLENTNMICSSTILFFTFLRNHTKYIVLHFLIMVGIKLIFIHGHYTKWICNQVEVHSGPKILKKSRPIKLIKSNKSISRIFFTKFHFLQFQKWPKINF